MTLVVLSACSSGGDGPSSEFSPICGDGIVESAEECDDGNSRGADGCAANCTLESLLAFPFTGSLNRGLFDETAVTGRLDWHIGAMTGPGGTRSIDGLADFAAGDVPVALRAEDAHFAPVELPGREAPDLEPRCVCLRAVARPRCAALPAHRLAACEYADQCSPETASCGAGPCGRGRDGNAAEGIIACGSAADLPFARYRYVERMIQPNFFESECVDVGAAPPPGSAVIAITLEASVSAGGCAASTGDPARGLDGLPCTADDPTPPFTQGFTVVLTTTAVGNEIPVICLGTPEECADVPRVVVDEEEGSPFSCGELERRPPAPGNAQLCFTTASGQRACLAYGPPG